MQHGVDRAVEHASGVSRPLIEARLVESMVPRSVLPKEHPAAAKNVTAIRFDYHSQNFVGHSAVGGGTHGVVVGHYGGGSVGGGHVGGAGHSGGGGGASGGGRHSGGGSGVAPVLAEAVVGITEQTHWKVSRCKRHSEAVVALPRGLAAPRPSRVAQPARSANGLIGLALAFAR